MEGKNLGSCAATLHDVLIFICSTSRTFFLPGKNQEAADGESVILIRGNFVLQRRSRRLSILIFQTDEKKGGLSGGIAKSYF